MIISRPPFRVSFFGGGTHYPAWYRQHGGSVLAAGIDKYCYLTCRFLPPFFEHRTRLVYSKIENCKANDEIAHPAVREALKFLKIERGLEIHCVADLPARSGIGSSSSFIVGLLHALYALQGKMPSQRQLALESIHLEQNVLRETVGSQDQVMAAHGGLKHVVFHEDGEISVRPVTLGTDRLAELNSHLMLFYTGIMRTASNVARSYVEDIESRQRQMQLMSRLVEESIGVLTEGPDMLDFGRLLDTAWQAKRSLSAQVSNSQVDELYELGRSAGAVGGKLLGAGGGGFLLLFVPPDRQPAVRARLDRLIHVPFAFDQSGSQIVFFDPDQDYAAIEEEQRIRTIDGFRELSIPKAA